MLKIFRKLFHAHVCVLSNQTLAIAYVRCKAFTQVNMQMNLRLITGELFHWSDHISCVAHVSLYCSHGYEPLWEKGLGKVWVEFFGHRGWYFLMVVCVNTCSSEQCNWMQVMALSIVCTFVPVLKSPWRRGQSIPGGWRYSRLQGAFGLCHWAVNSQKERDRQVHNTRLLNQLQLED